MALDAHLKANGTIQGKSLGTSLKKGRRGTVEVLAFSQVIESPFDQASGQPSGKVIYGPFVITKNVDGASNFFLEALISRELLTSVELDFYKADPKTGKEYNHYTIVLGNARVNNIQQEQLNNKVPENMRHDLREHISFMYENINWVNNDSSSATYAERLGSDRE